LASHVAHVLGYPLLASRHKLRNRFFEVSVLDQLQNLFHLGGKKELFFSKEKEEFFSKKNPESQHMESQYDSYGV
jgi:hypothetical protein